MHQRTTTRCGCVSQVCDAPNSFRRRCSALGETRSCRAGVQRQLMSDRVPSEPRSDRLQPDGGGFGRVSRTEDSSPKGRLHRELCERGGRPAGGGARGRVASSPCSTWLQRPPAAALRVLRSFSRTGILKPVSDGSYRDGVKFNVGAFATTSGAMRCQSTRRKCADCEVPGRTREFQNLGTGR